MVCCPKCGANLPENAKFCGNCGTIISNEKYKSAKNIENKADFSIKEYYKELCTIEGRINRLKFFKNYAILFIMFLITSFLLGVIASLIGIEITETNLSILVILACLPYFIPWWCLIFKRLHDFNKGKGLAILAVIPYVGTVFLIVLCFIPGTKGPNKYGPDPLANR